MTFFCAVRLASSNAYLHTNYGLIRSFFHNFVAQFKEIHGGEFMTSNIHNLLHVIDDIERFGLLPSISAYPFESYLGKIKSIVQAGVNPLPQIARRLIERSNVSAPIAYLKRCVITIKKEKCTIEIRERNFMLCNHRFADSWFFTQGKIIKMKCALKKDGHTFVKGYALRTHCNFFTFPIPSSLMNIYSSDVSDMTTEEIVVNTLEIVCKFLCIRNDDNNMKMKVNIPILHTEKLCN